MSSVVEKPVVKGLVDGNIFAVMGAAARALKQAGQGDKVKEMMDKVNNSGGYDMALAIITDYVDFNLSGDEEDEEEDECDEDCDCDDDDCDEEEEDEEEDDDNE